MASFASQTAAAAISIDSSYGENTITISPTNALKNPHSALVVLMHGLGDTANGFSDVAEMWQKVRKPSLVDCKQLFD